MNGSGGTVTIYGGTVTASGGTYGTGIGGGQCGSNGTLTLGTGINMLVSEDDSSWSPYNGTDIKRYMKAFRGKIDLSGADVAVDKEEQTVTIKYGETILAENIDYTVSYYKKTAILTSRTLWKASRRNPASTRQRSLRRRQALFTQAQRTAQISRS